MNYPDFEIYYSERKEFFKREFEKELWTKAYIKLKKGSEIRVQDLDKIYRTKKKPISEILIDVPQVRISKEKINKALKNVKISNEGDIRIVYGDFGHGKSQTANLIVESIRSNNISNQIVYIENITTFRIFIINFTDYLGNLLFKNNKHLFNKVEPILDFLKKANDQSISISKIRSIFIKLIKELSERDYITILFLDELNKVLHDQIEIQHWIDFFITLTDESNLSLLLVCFIPQSTDRAMINIDKRMERWNTFFGIDATYLDGKYGSKVLLGIANLLALSSLNHYIDLSKNSLEFIYNIFLFRKDYLEGASIRKINTWTINLSELIIECKKYNLWERVKEFNRLDRTDKGLFIESKLRSLLSIDQLPQFELKRKDSEEKEIYRVEYQDENLRVENKKSDGHYQQFVQFINTEKLKLKILDFTS